MRRISYDSAVGPETFIVPLLNDHIVEAVKSIDNKKNDLVLDVGCGNQPFRTLLTSEGWQYESLDIEQNQIGNVDYLGKIDDPIEIHKKYDFIFCTEVLEHVLDWKAAFKNFCLLIKDQGYLLISTPFFYPLHEEPYDFWRPTQYAIEAFAKNHGFQMERCNRSGDAFDVIGTISNSIFMKPKGPGLRAKLLYLLLFNAQKWLLKKLKKKVIQQNIEVESKYYLSNIILLRKVAI